MFASNIPKCLSRKPLYPFCLRSKSMNAHDHVPRLYQNRNTCSKTCRRSAHGLSLRYPQKTYLSSTMHDPAQAHSYPPSLISSLARSIKRSHVVHRASSLHRGDPPLHRGEAITSPRSPLSTTTCVYRTTIYNMHVTLVRET